MSQPLHVISTSRTTAELEESFVLSEDPSKSTRRIVKAEFVDNPKDPEAGVRVIISHQRRTKSNSWEDCPPFNLIHVKTGEEIRLELRSGETKLLLQALQTFKAIYVRKGIPWGTAEVVVGTPDEVVLTDPVRAEAMRKLLATNQTQEVWEALIEHAPEALTRLCLGRVQQERVEVLDRFSMMLAEDLAESTWQAFFEANTWIFGYGLEYRFLTPIRNQPQYGGTRLDGRGGQRGDGLLASESHGTRFSVLVEIKRPDTKLFEATTYRNGAWQLGHELVGAISQIQTNCQTWQRSAEAPDNLRDLDRQRVHTREPKGILVVGHTNQFTGGDEDIVKAQTFESFRRNLHNPEIITFDELYQRAKFIVDHGAQLAAPATPGPTAIEQENDEDDLP